MKEKVSVVVPVYNAEKYITKCINSICEQTYKNLEIIIVNDGSKDNSAYICDKLQQSDSRIIVIHKENEGAGKSRNRGISIASGKYILFVDSDDYIKPTLIEKCVEAANGCDSAVIMFGIEDVDEAGKIIRKHIPYSDQYTFSGPEVTEKFLPEMIYSENKNIRNIEIPACMAHFYSLYVIKKMSWGFESEREFISEDLFSLLKLYINITKVIVINEALYCYRHGHQSLSSSSSRLMNYPLIKKFYSQCLFLCEKNNYSDRVIQNICEPYLSFTITCLKLKSLQKKKITEVSKELKEILEDDLLNMILESKNLQNEKLTKRILYKSILKHNYLFAELLIGIHARKG